MSAEIDIEPGSPRADTPQTPSGIISLTSAVNIDNLQSNDFSISQRFLFSSLITKSRNELTTKQNARLRNFVRAPKLSILHTKML